MDGSVFTWAWLAAGILLLASELFAPSLTAVFFGISAVLIAGLRAVGLVESHVVSMALWLVGSAFLFWLLHAALKRRYQPEVSREITSEDARAFGAMVEVVAPVNDRDTSGRIRYDGTSWPAISTKGLLPEGSRARLLHRDNLAWVVDPVDPPILADSLTDPLTTAGDR